MVQTDPKPRRAGPRRSPQASGFGITEVLVAASCLALAILGLASSTLAGHRLARSEEARGLALETTRTFLERLRADQDWAGLYARLWARVDPTLVPAGSTWPITDYYADFDVPPELGELRVRVEVPASTPAGMPPGTPAVLREDAALPVFGLPYDLNGDGAIDSASHGGDYRALPVIVNFHWSPPGEISQSLRATVWLKGER